MDFLFTICPLLRFQTSQAAWVLHGKINLTNYYSAICLFSASKLKRKVHHADTQILKTTFRAIGGNFSKTTSFSQIKAKHIWFGIFFSDNLKPRVQRLELEEPAALSCFSCVRWIVFSEASMKIRTSRRKSGASLREKSNIQPLSRIFLLFVYIAYTILLKSQEYRLLRM